MEWIITQQGSVCPVGTICDLVDTTLVMQAGRQGFKPGERACFYIDMVRLSVFSIR